MYINGREFISAKILNPLDNNYEVRYRNDNGGVITENMKCPAFKKSNIYSVHSNYKNNINTISISLLSDKSRAYYIKTKEHKMGIVSFICDIERDLIEHNVYCKLHTLYWSIANPLIGVHDIFASFGDYYFADMYNHILKNGPTTHKQHYIASLLSTYRFNVLKYDRRNKKYIKGK